MASLSIDAPTQSQSQQATSTDLEFGPPLEEEELGTGTAEDARSWIRVYTELLHLHQRRHKTNGARDATQEGYQSRLDQWYSRLDSLVGLDIDGPSKTLHYREGETPLTGREFQLLQCLMRNPGVPLTSPQLLGQAWHRPDLSPEQVRIYIFRLRVKLQRSGVPYSLMHEARRGYWLEHQPA